MEYKRVGFEQWTKQLWLAVTLHTLVALSQHKSLTITLSNDPLFRSVTTSWSVLIFIACDLPLHSPCDLPWHSSCDLPWHSPCDLPWHSSNAFASSLFGVAWIPHDHSNFILTEQTFSSIVWIRKIWSSYCLTVYWAVTSPLKVDSERLP
jgi:hypothetical protein